MSDVLAVVICGVLLLACLALGRLIQWLTEVETCPQRGPTRPRAYLQCVHPGCHAPADQLLLTWTYYGGEALDHREYCLCRHHREQAQAKIDYLLQDTVEA